jgi:diguanylate cyclase (GGDEF)-like protein/putative nucleotidyltransferase with HDIG domain
MSTTRFQDLSTGTQAYIAGVVAAGAVTVLQSFYDLTVNPIGWNWTILAVLTLVSGSATVRLPSLPATISVSETFVFTSVLLFGSSAGTLTVALDALVISFWSYRKGHRLYKIVFNVCALPLTIWIAAHIFFLFPSIDPLITTRNSETIPIKTLIGPLLVFTIVYFSLNSWIITFAIALEQRLPPFRIWRDNFLWLSLNYFGGASVAALLVSYTKDLDYTYLAVIVPLLVVLYLTFSMSMGRVEDANRHVTQLSKLYMSTIETLAMAIDAKDQITHGHIRRVQTYAVALAKEVGVTDTSLIRAVEAAALLHDMGKLAVPEYILNKPGPLTPAEFDKMKLHATVGADILSAIDFPYPVVPIVRHHHENWNGTGYPSGLAGTDIPIGARILSVVDCFDALTSDRPYRPRLADKDAIRILIERRGSMYDPLVVDTFARVYTRIIPQSLPVDDNSSLAAITEASSSSMPLPQSNRRLDDIAASTDEMLTLFDLARGLTPLMTLQDVGDMISKHLRRLVPCSLCVFFVYNVDSDELIAAHASGDNAELVTDLRIGLGQRLSGWVAANRQSIRNSDPVLDLGEVARGIVPRPRSCLSTPLSIDKELVGVLTLYSTSRDAFSDEHQRIIEAVSRQVSSIVKKVTDSTSKDKPSALRDQVTGLPLVEQMRHVTGPFGEATLPKPTSLLLIDVDNLGAINRSHGRPAGDEVLARVVVTARRCLRPADLFFRHGSDEFIVLLLQTSFAAAQSVSERIHDAAKMEQPGVVPRFGLTVVAVTMPEDGVSIDDLIQRAASNLRHIRAQQIDRPPESIH